MTNLLQGKYAVVFGAGGSIGAAVAKEVALEGAEVFLSGRNRANVEAVTNEITAGGGRAHAAVVDALDDSAVNQYIDGVVKQTGRLDLAFNAVGPLIGEYGNGLHAVELPIEQFMTPITTVVKAQFITARAAARHMVKQRSGAIVFLTGSPARGHVEGATAIGAAFGAIESLSENFAVELSPQGVRVVCLRTTMNVDSRTIQQTMQALANRMNVTKEEMTAHMTGLNWLKTAAYTSDTAKAVVFIASDRARMMTGTVMNMTAGAAAD